MLITDPHFEAPDEFFEALVATHRGLDAEAGHALDARLVLLLANHIGSREVLEQALRLARADAAPAPASP